MRTPTMVIYNQLLDNFKQWLKDPVRWLGNQLQEKKKIKIRATAYFPCSCPFVRTANSIYLMLQVSRFALQIKLIGENFK